MAYEIRFAATARRHLRTFSAHQRAIIVDAVESQLSHEPLTEVRNRKRLRPNPLAPWELRVGEVRVFYDVDEPGVVTILAIGTKRRSKFFIDGEQIDL